MQHVAIRYTERLAEVGAVASVGSKGDSYDNAMAEAFNSLFKAELVRNHGPWKNIDDLEFAVAEYIDWFNFRRLQERGVDEPARLDVIAETQRLRDRALELGRLGRIEDKTTADAYRDYASFLTRVYQGFLDRRGIMG